MIPVDKKELHINMPEGTKEVVFAKDQPEYLPLPALVTPDGRVISTWQPNEGELALLNEGVPITLTVWHGELCSHNLLRPVRLEVGGTNGKI
jgi:hypothetical protein